MPILPTQIHREVSVKSALGADALLFKRIRCSEALGRLSAFRVELGATRGDIAVRDVLGTGLTVSLDLADGGARHFHGIVTRFSYCGWRDGMAHYEAVVQPALWLLTRSVNCRIFQNRTALEIVKAVCEDVIYAGQIALDASALSATPASRDYCVQYRESDFNFVVRLLEEEGIYFYFIHADGSHKMMLADGYGAHQAARGYETLPFRDEQRERDPLREAVTRFLPGGEIQPSVMVLNDFDFEKPSASANGGLLAKAHIAAAFGQTSYEHYDYPGGYFSSDAGNGFARARMEILHGQCEQIDAFGNARGLTTGALFTLSGHPRDDQNREFLITAAETEIVGTDYGAGGAGASTEMRCAFKAVGKEHAFRPRPIARRPVVQGPQTATVAGKSGEEIWTDRYGRVKLQFHWDRDGHSDESSSCFVRVQQGWAGKGWGMMFIPRVGMEAVVTFLEGDPDRPLVTGCVYNGDNLPPYALPDHQTRATIMSNSSTGGAGFNEVRFEDKKDGEEIYVQAQKDFRRVVKNDDALKVSRDRKVEVGHDETVTVGGNRSTSIGGDHKLTVSKTIVIEATTSIELKVGASSVKIEAAAITLKSPQVTLQADANMEIKAGAVMTVEGALVKIN